MMLNIEALAVAVLMLAVHDLENRHYRRDAEQFLHPTSPEGRLHLLFWIYQAGYIDILNNLTEKQVKNEHYTN